MSKLKAKKPTEIKKRLKALFYGVAGSGKTTAAAGFPDVYMIDTEDATGHKQYVELLAKNNSVVFQTQDFEEVIDQVKALLTEKHPYKTVVIDSMTILYNSLLNKAEAKVGNEFGRHYNEANKSVKRLLDLLLRLDMNVIVTAHSKNEYGQNLAIIGEVFDCYKKLDYIFDLVLQIQKRGAQRVAIIKKSRIETLPDGENFPFSYAELADRYGRDVMEKEAETQVLASKEQVVEFKRLAELFKLPPETVDKWLDKAQADKIEEMPADAIQKCIDYLTKQVTGEKSDV